MTDIWIYVQQRDGEIEEVKLRDVVPLSVGLETAGFESAFAVVTEERDEALVSYALLDGQPHSAPGRLRLRGLDREGRYRVSVIWPRATADSLAPTLAQLDGSMISGDALMSAGLQLPILQPQSLFILHLQRG